MQRNNFQVLSRLAQRFQSLALLTVFSIFFANEQSLAGPELINNIVSVKFIHGWKEGNRSIQGAIHFELSPGWKTYWKNPGRFGIRPIFDWTQSQNVKSIEFLWPTPKIFEQYDVKVIGYEEVLTIPIKIIKINPVDNFKLKMNLTFGVCSNICLLKTAEIHNLEVPEESSATSKLINEAKNSVPSKVIDQTVSQYKCVIQITDDDLALNYTVELIQEPITKPEMILEYVNSELYLQNQETTVKEKSISVKASLKNISQTMGVIERNQISAILIIDGSGFELQGCP